MIRLQISHEQNSTRNSFRANKNPKVKQIVQLKEPETKTSPFAINYIEECTTSAQLNLELKFVKI